MAAEQPREITKGKTEGDFDENMIFFGGGGTCTVRSEQTLENVFLWTVQTN